MLVEDGMQHLHSDPGVQARAATYAKWPVCQVVSRGAVYKNGK